MNWEAISAASELVGAVAVVASLIFVGYQLRQNTREIRLSSTNDVLSQFEATIRGIAHDDEISSLLFRGVPDPESIEGIEKYRFTLLCQSYYFYLAKAHYQFRSGTLEPAIWDAIRSQMMNFMNAPGLSAYWEKHGWNFPAEFRAYVEQELKKGADEGWSLAGTNMRTPPKHES
ncbi:MAG: hypothetical protein RIC85_01615 [Gammaproteobacteria bacterium]